MPQQRHGIGSTARSSDRAYAVRNLPSRGYCGGVSRRGRLGAVVVDFDLSMTNRIPHGLGVLIDFLAHDDFLVPHHALLDDRLLVSLDNLDLALLRHGEFAGARNRAMLDLDPLVACGYRLLDRTLDGVGMHPHTALLDDTLADLQLLLIDRDYLFLHLGRTASRGGGGCRSCSGCAGSGCRSRSRRTGRGSGAVRSAALPMHIPRRLAGMNAGPASGAPLLRVLFDVDRVEPGQYPHDAVMLAGGSADHQNRMTTAEALGEEVRILVG